MNAAEKKELFDFLVTAEGWLSERRIKTGEPVFSDTSRKKQNSPDSIESIYTAIRSCKNCDLAGKRTHAVPGEGPENLREVTVMVIGEGPGADEDATGRPFVGKAGQLLDKMLASINLSRTENCYITNIVKCRPPQNRDPLPEEAAACIGYLEKQIALIRPKMILAVGRIATQQLLNTTEGINRLRGRFFTYREIPLLATYHPSALLRNEELKRPAWEDLKIFRAELEKLLATDKK
ncbi:uracil-DNA glycosylase [Brucepastera parasyntrophica]|uniref:uracil-DNA glycosylase n=1 Tax=Brucepastera parasyntrophica TaxID=2880008 RepID=UPI00210EA8B8|nr:uracil-DNA glycosylase [Brucepastera parasyntrophica]ULQ59715.1 uracil-DNA glycosylase [Brucepastera parasyntrophica]